MADMSPIALLLLATAAVGILLAILIIVIAFVQKGTDIKESLAYEAEAEASLQETHLQEPPEGVQNTQEDAPFGVTQKPLALDEESEEEQEDVETASAIQIGPFTIRISSAQHIGARKEQQDAITISSGLQEETEKHGLLTILCDGMGGMKMGTEAATIGASAFARSYMASAQPPQEALAQAVHMANEKVWDLCQVDDLSGAGTTLVAALIDQEGFRYLSVGDSHVYLYRGGTLSQLNADHNYLAELLMRVRKGEITRDEALSDPERTHLTSYLGMKEVSLIDQSSGAIELEAGDRIVLASDGLFKVLPPQEIARYINPFGETTATSMVDAVLSHKYRNQDNVSIVIVALDAT